MSLPPGPHPLDVFWAAEVVAIGRLAQPALLAGLFAGQATIGFGTVMLAVLIAVIRNEKLAATAALASCGAETHCLWKSTHLPAPIKGKPNPEENRKGRRKKRLSNKVPEENPSGRKRIFKPALFHHFHSAADSRW
jgi:hypothetical protein